MQNKLSQYPDFMLIEEANRIEKSFVDWSGGEMLIDEELESRYLDIAPELEHYEEYQQFDDALLSLAQ